MRLPRKNDFRANKRELVDTAYLVVLQGASYLLPLIVMPYLLIILQPTGYGYVGFSFSLVQYFTLIVDFGFNLSGTKRIAQAATTDERNRIFINIASAKMLLLIVSTLIMALIVGVIPQFHKYIPSIIATWPMILGTAFTYMFFFQGIGKIRIFTILNTVAKVCLLPLIFVFVRHQTDYVLAAFLQSVVFMLSAILSLVYLFKKHLVRLARPSWQGIKEEISVSFPLFLSTASTSAYTQLFVVILGYFCATETVGLFSSADRIVRAFVFLLYAPIVQVYFPKISNLAVRDKIKAATTFRQLLQLVAISMILISACIFIFAPLLPVILGYKFQGTLIYVRILSVLPFFISIGGIYGQVGLVALGDRQSALAFRNVYLLVACVAIALALVVAPTLKSVGICSLESFSELLVMVLMWKQYRKFQKRHVDATTDT